MERDGRVRLKVGGAKPELAGGRLFYIIKQDILIYIHMLHIVIAGKQLDHIFYFFPRATPGPSFICINIFIFVYYICIYIYIKNNVVSNS